jgi:hypothetical protein
MVKNEDILFVIKEIISDDTQFKNLRKQFPEIVGDLVSFKYNPNCSCKSKVGSYFKKKLEENNSLLDEYINTIPELKQKLEEIQKDKEKILSGKIIKISKKSWEEFAKDIKEKYYRSFSITEKNEELTIYFI